MENYNVFLNISSVEFNEYIGQLRQQRRQAQRVDEREQKKKQRTDDRELLVDFEKLVKQIMREKNQKDDAKELTRRVEIENCIAFLKENFKDEQKNETKGQRRQNREDYKDYIAQMRQTIDEYNRQKKQKRVQREIAFENKIKQEREQLKQQGPSTRVGQRGQGIGHVFPFHNDVFSNTKEHTLGGVFPFRDDFP